ncbi:MAG: T9SS type A sorting domain-containing protein [Bacteroidetes bacterium]|nr:T9SS type A sorting domain-containing protein [Bacteroidota bacterium]
MRKRTSFAAIFAIALLGVILSAGSSFAQLFNYTPYPFISINQETYYQDGNYLVPDALPGGARYFLVPVFIYNVADPLKNPNTKDGTWKDDNSRISGVDGQFLVPIRSFSFQLHYPNQAVMLDDDPAHGSPIVTLGPDKSSASSPTLAAPFYFRYTEQSANDTTNPFHRIIRVTGASEVPLPLSPIPAVDSDQVLLYIRFKIIPNWTVNTTIMQLDSAVFADHLGDPQYDPNNWRRGNLAGHRLYQRGQLPVYITAQPAFEFRPFSVFSTQDNKNYDLLPTLVFDPTDPNAQPPSINIQLRDAVASTRLTNVTITTDQDWLTVGTSSNGGQHSIFIQKIDYPGSISSQEVNLWITANPAGLLPGVYYGYVTLTSDGASNSPARIRVMFVVRARPDEPSEAGGTGIRLNITNSCTPTCTRTLVFGTGAGASEGIDLLYGETEFTVGDRALAQSNPDTTQRCYAYFEPLNPNADPEYQNPNFLGTLRDIRSNTTDSTILYKVTFGSGGPLCYPITVCLDPTDLPEGSRVVIRDILNGGNFSFNMREATPVGGQRCIVLRDPSITSFIIEYTRGTKGQFAELQKQAWNFVSLPVVAPDQSPATIFPNATGPAFSYASNAGWTAANQLEFGRGYMIHYGSVIGNDNLVAGTRSYNVSNLRIHAGWNSVGGCSTPVCTDPSKGYIFFTPVAGSNPNPLSEYFEYVPGHGYQTVGYIVPGHGYFVKVSDEGFYNVHGVTNEGCKNIADPTAQLKSELVKVTVRDAAQNAQDLYFGNAENAQPASHYEMPPAFMSFDARFTANNGNIVTGSEAQAVKISSTDYPVTMNFENLNGTVEVRDLTGNVIGSVNGKGSVVIRDASVKTVIVALKGSTTVAANGFSLESAYPNPASSISNFTYSVPTEMFVNVTLTNALGQEVSKLVNATVAAGSHQVQIDGSKLAEGTYFFTIHAGNFSQTQKVTIAH